ncbi:hypothetical protein 1013_scaffold47_00116 [Bacteriophage sp.]|nr:hypothetical protein 1013_scaffold47_00116 [Bacteriophage sp.]
MYPLSPVTADALFCLTPCVQSFVYFLVLSWYGPPCLNVFAATAAVSSNPSFTARLISSFQFSNSAIMASSRLSMVALNLFPPFPLRKVLFSRCFSARMYDR